MDVAIGWDNAGVNVVVFPQAEITGNNKSINMMETSFMVFLIYGTPHPRDIEISF